MKLDTKVRQTSLMRFSFMKIYQNVEPIDKMKMNSKLIFFKRGTWFWRVDPEVPSIRMVILDDMSPTKNSYFEFFMAGLLCTNNINLMSLKKLNQIYINNIKLLFQQFSMVRSYVKLNGKTKKIMICINNKWNSYWN